MIFNFFKKRSGAKINPATEDTLATIKSQTDLLSFDAGSNPANLKVNIASIAAGGIDFGLQNASNVVINPATEDTLNTIKTKVSQMVFDTSGLVTSGIAPTLNSGGVSVKNISKTNINPASAEATYLWMKMVKMMESKGTVDANRIKRITIDSFGTDSVTGIGASTGIGVSGGVVPVVTIANGYRTQCVRERYPE
jgi:hypothetical protein